MNSASLAACSILVCEDEPLIALEIADGFTNAGARVLKVRSFAHALIAVEDEVPSVVILDHALTDGESSQLRECLKERNIPYVLHSGYGTREHGWAAADNAAYVPKPASPQHLVTTVEGLLRGRGRRACVLRASSGRRIQVVSVSQRDCTTFGGSGRVYPAIWSCNT